MTNSTLIPLASGLVGVLAGFLAEDQALGSVLGLLFVSLAAIGIVAVLLGGGCWRGGGARSLR